MNKYIEPVNQGDDLADVRGGGDSAKPTLCEL